MKIILDLQGAQASGRFRGVGRYTSALAKAMLQHGRRHEFWITLNGSMPESAAELTETFSSLLPRQRIRSFNIPAPVSEIDPANAWRTRAAEILREHFLADLAPDLVHVSSLFEGIGHDAATSVGLAGTGVPTAVTLYDLIPLLQPESYLTDERVLGWYLRKAQSLKRADLLLAISSSSASEAINELHVPGDRITTIGTGVDPVFRPVALGMAEEARLRVRYGLTQGVVLYTGGADPRKNLQGLINGFAGLPPQLRQTHRIVIAGELLDEEKRLLREAATNAGLQPDGLTFLGYVPDTDLIALYSICAAFVFPSLHEGFGLPAAEAMACGAPVIGSNTTSIPEVIGLAEALFNPRDPDDISAHLGRVLTDQTFRLRLKAHGPVQAGRFTWDAVAMRALDAFERLHHARDAEKQVMMSSLRGVPNKARPSLAFISPLPGTRNYTADVAAELLRELACYYDITCIVDQVEITDPWVRANFPRRDSSWFMSHSRTFSRTLYCFTESPEHLYVLNLLRICPGTVLLLDFPFSTPTVSRSQAGLSMSMLQMLYKMHGLEAVAVAKEDGISAALAQFPDIEELLNIADGVIVDTPNGIATIGRLYGQEAAAVMRTLSAPLRQTGCHRVEAAKECRDAIEHFAAGVDRMRPRRLIEQLAQIADDPEPTAVDLKSVAIAIAENAPSFGRKQILIDVTALAIKDAGTGIQRVTRNVAANLITSPPAGYRVELVRLADFNYIYARDYASRFLGLEDEGGLLPDEPVELRRGDIFLGLDLNLHAPSVRPWFEAMRYQGVAVFFVVYDLLPATMPSMFGTEIEPLYRAWLSMIIEITDGLLCISRSVADDLHSWIKQIRPQRAGPLRIGWFHQGAELGMKRAVSGLSAQEEQQLLAATSGRPCVLTVGTIEPRKGYRQVVAAFDTLWRQGVDVALVIVGIKGWMMEDLISRIEGHPERGRRLFWLPGISDSMLARFYQTATVLLAASLGEGFGLPLVEAAQCELPIIARDLPVFREVAGGHASYFETEDPDQLANVISQWLVRHDTATSPTAHPAWLNWKQSADQLLAFIVGDVTYQVICFDERLDSLLEAAGDRVITVD